MVVVPSRGVRVTVAESLIRDLSRVCECCDLCGMKLNASKTNTIIIQQYIFLKQDHKIYNWHSNKNTDGSVNRFASCYCDLPRRIIGGFKSVA